MAILLLGLFNGAVITCRAADQTFPPPSFQESRPRLLTAVYQPREEDVPLIDYTDLDELVSRLDQDQNVRVMPRPLPCDCRHSNQLAMVQIFFKSQIINYKELECDGGRKLHSFAAPTLCLTPNLVSLVAAVFATAILFALVVLARVLVARYASIASAWLYVRGCCLPVLQRREPDDTKYDVYISFADSDTQFVYQELVPHLESPDYGLTVCVRQRDWDLGAPVVTEAERCVRQSRRSLLVVSRGFARCPWALHELRTANTAAGQDGRKQVILVLLEDIPPEELAAELRAYLTTNTYLHRNDPCFWERLVYTLPHRRPKHSFATNSHRLDRTPLLMESAADYEQIPLRLLPPLPPPEAELAQLSIEAPPPPHAASAHGSSVS